jgi:ankyrin repeat protein
MTLLEVARAIAHRDPVALGLIGAFPALARISFREGATRDNAAAWYFAAATYDPRVARTLVVAGADVCARNRRGAEPLHYAADGGPTSRNWKPRAQANVISYLIEAGANPNSVDKSGVAPLHRAVRNRCAGAVRALLAGGASPQLKNKSGSTPIELAAQTTGRGGSGARQAKREQAEILRLLEAHPPRA